MFVSVFKWPSAFPLPTFNGYVQRFVLLLRDNKTRHRINMRVCACMCLSVCVWETERERERLYMCVCARKTFSKNKYSISEFPGPCGPQIELSVSINLHFNEVFFQGVSSLWIL